MEGYSAASVDPKLFSLRSLGIRIDETKPLNDFMQNSVKKYLMKHRVHRFRGSKNRDVFYSMLDSSLTLIRKSDTRYRRLLHAGRRFLKKLYDPTQNEEGDKVEKMSPLVLRSGFYGPTNAGASCYCDATLMAMFMSNSTSDMLLSTEVNEMTWLADSWIIGSEATIPKLRQSNSREDALKSANSMRLLLKSVMETLRTQSGGKSAIQSETQQKISFMIDYLKKFGMDPDSSKPEKDSQEVISIVCNLLGGTTLWNPILKNSMKIVYLYVDRSLVLTTVTKSGSRKYRHAVSSTSIPRNKFDYIVEKESQKAIEVKGKDLLITNPFGLSLREESNVTFLETHVPKVGPYMPTLDELDGITPSSDEDDDYDFILPNFPLMRKSGSSIYISVKQSGSDVTNFQTLLEEALGITRPNKQRGVIEVITDADATSIRNIFDSGGPLIKGITDSNSLPQKVPCYFRTETVSLVHLPELFIVVIGRADSPGVVNTTRLSLFSNGSSIISIKFGEAQIRYTLVSAVIFYPGHYTCYIRHKGTSDWIYYNDTAGNFVSRKPSEAEPEIETRSYILVFDRITD